MNQAGNQEYHIEFKINQNEPGHFHQDIELLYVMSGKIKMDVLEQEYVLNSDDFIVVNSNHRHAWIVADEDTAVCEIHFNFNMLREHIAKKFVFFHCNSTIGGDYAYEELRNQIEYLLSECAVNVNNDTFRKNAYIYHILDILISNFLVADIKEDDKQDDMQLERALQYIDANHGKAVSVAEMAELLYIAPSSFSRYFKKMMNVNFIDYLNHVRLHYALQEICYTNESITWIANAHGFSTASAFCKIFKDKYGVSPKQYRHNFENQSEIVSKENKLLEQYLKKYEKGDMKETAYAGKITETSVEVNCQNFSMHHFAWNKAINVGFAEDLLNKDICLEIIQCKKKLGLKMVRISGLFSEHMMLYRPHAMHINNFAYIDSVLDFIVEQHLTPIISIDNKEKSVVKNVKMQAKGISTIPQHFLFETMDEFLIVLQDFLKHILQRYGMKNVSDWIFECWYEASARTVMGIQTDYVEAFSKISQRIKKVIPTARIGGWGISNVEDGDEYTFTQIMKAWQKSDIRPDFISLNLYPYGDFEKIKENGRNREIYVLKYFNSKIKNCRIWMNKYGMQEIPLCIGEWGISMSMRNYFNETSGNAAMMLQVMLMDDVRVEYAAYGSFVDYSEIYSDTSRYLFGGRGIINASGAKKPSYYALMLYNQLRDYLIYKDKNCVITTDAYGSYTILYYNVKQLKYKYFYKSEEAISEDELEDIFEDKKYLEMVFKLNDIENGIYNIKEYCLNKNHGSLINEWIRFGKDQMIDTEDASYLKDIAQPAIRRKTMHVENHTLIFKQVMQPNEIGLIKIYKK